MALGQQKSRLITRAIVYALLAFGAFLFIMPFVWMISTSLKPNDQIFSLPPKWIPNPVMWHNYPESFTYFPFPRYLRNTLVIVFLSTASVILSSSLIAYGFSRLRFPGRNALFYLLLATMMLPAQVTMVPIFLLFRNLGWVDTFLPLIVPLLFGYPFFVFLLRQFFLTIPQDLIDAARIDGCSELDIWWRIVMPLSKPALATVAIFSVMMAWNDFLAPLIYLNSESKKTVALGLQQFYSFHGTEWALLMASSVMMVLPIVVVFFFAQKYFVRGITLTGMKG